MNKWIIPAVIMVFAVLMVSTTFISGVTAHSADNSKINTETNQAKTNCGSASCQGSCTAESNCGESACGATTGGSCGCGR